MDQNRTGRRYCLVSAGVGGVVWLAGLGREAVGREGLVLISLQWAVQLLGLAVLVLVPLVLRIVIPAGGRLARGVWWAAAIWQLPAAGAFLYACALPTGGAAAVWTVPWVGEIGLIVLLGFFRGVQAALGRRGAQQLSGWAVSDQTVSDQTASDWAVSDWVVAAGLMLAGVGGVSAWQWRAGLTVFEFEPQIILLTAVHFHYAGLVLPVATGLATGRLRGRLITLAGVPVVLGLPCVGSGIIATQLGGSGVWECAAVAVMTTAGCLTAVLHLRLAGDRRWPVAARGCWGVAGVSLVAGMALATWYGLRSLQVFPPIDIVTMVGWHGTINALGFALPVLVGWNRVSAEA